MSEESKSSSISLSSASTIAVSTATDDVVQGNKSMPYNLNQAIRLFTKATRNRHPVAFLNRSLCYMATDKPDLAAMDAQRAYCFAAGTHAGYQDSKVSRQLYEYANVCERAGDENAFWATLSPEFLQRIGVPVGLRDFRLMKLTIRSEPSPDHMLKTNEAFDAFDDVRAKALFRLALALSKCGCGAQRSAISVLELASSVCHNIGKGESLWLGSKFAIALQIQFDRHRSTRGNADGIDHLMASRYALFDIHRYSAYRDSLAALNKSIQDLDYRAAVTLVDMGGEYTLTPTQDTYPGDILFTEETVLSVSTADARDVDTLYYCDTCCAIIDTAAKIFGERPPNLDLNIDINVGEDGNDNDEEDSTTSLEEALSMMPPLASHSHSHLVAKNKFSFDMGRTSIPSGSPSPELQEEDSTIITPHDDGTSMRASSEAEYLDEDDYMESGHHDSAAADEQTMGGNRYGIIEKVVSTPISEHHPDRVISPEGLALSPSTDEGLIEEDIDAPIVTPDPEAETELPPSPPQHRILPSRTKASRNTIDFKFCDYCETEVYWCSSECKAMALACHHTLLCGSDVEELLRGTVNVASHPMTPTTDERLLTMLLLARVFSWSLTRKQNPLENPAVKLLAVTAPRVDRPDREYATWSYDTHVIAPLLVLEAIDLSRNQVAYDTTFADGHIINVLTSLIDRHLHVETSPRWYKIYNYSGDLNAIRDSKGKGGKEPEGGDDGMETEPASKFVHGRLRPLCGLLTTPPRHFRPNVELVDIGDNRIVCIPLIGTSVTASREALLRTGEPLYVASHTIRSATDDERKKYPRKTSIKGPCPAPDSDVEEEDVEEESIEDTLEAYVTAQDDDDDMMDEEWSLSEEDY